MNSTSIIALLVIVLLTFVILVAIILLDHRKNVEELSLLEGGNTVEPSARKRTSPFTSRAKPATCGS
jgi:preprotein translocase subunit SecG